MFDNATIHTAKSDKALNVYNMNLSPGGASTLMHQTTFTNPRGFVKHQEMNETGWIPVGQPTNTERFYHEKPEYGSLNIDGTCN